MATETMIELDVDDDLEAVADRLRARGGAHLLEEWGQSGTGSTCARARTSNRLMARRWAAKPPAPGTGYSIFEHLHLVDDELERMGVSAEEAQGCQADSCPVCNPPVCGRCGGLGGDPCGLPA
jgi:hypothetical protein